MRHSIPPFEVNVGDHHRFEVRHNNLLFPEA
jgi:hypothetical protein